MCLLFANYKVTQAQVEPSQGVVVGATFSTTTNLKSVSTVGDTFTGRISNLNIGLTQGIIQPDFTTTDSQVKVKVMIEGAFDTATNEMTTSLTSFLPTTQPFNTAPFYYTGSETIANIPSIMTDWVLLEVREANNNSVVVEQVAAILLKNGNVVDTNSDFTNGNIPNAGVTFSNLAFGSDYYIVVRSRNHLAVMSAIPITFPNTAVYDFTDNVSQAYNFGSNQMKLINGKALLFAGDINGDGFVNTTDKNIYTQNAANFFGYFNADINLDFFVTTDDLNLYSNNASLFTIPQLWY